jgi:hypothetical protein
LSDIKQYLLDHVRKEPGPLGDDCWIWTASLSEGYGQFYWNGRTGRAHRMAHEVFVRPIPAGAQVQHKCDRKDCINPKHLYLGTQAQNIADIFSRGDPDLTRQQFEALCDELAKLDHNVEVSNQRREQIEAQLRRTIKDHRNEWGDAIKERRALMRQQRKAAREELQQQIHDRRTQRLARRSPEALARLKASIAEVKESTPEELNADRAAEIAQRKRERLRRLGSLNGSGIGASEEDSHA